MPVLLIKAGMPG